MESIALHTSYLNWVFPAFLLVFGLVAFLRTFYPKHFADYQRLLVNNKYIVIYGKKETRGHLFTIVLYFLQCISLSLFLYIWLKSEGITQLFNQRFMYLELLVIVIIVLSIKLLFQRWISSRFELSEFSKEYIFSRISYTSYASIMMILVLFIGVYSQMINRILLYTLLLLLLIISILSWVKIINANRKEIKSYLLYFILYLCTLEIAPYVYLFYGVKTLFGNE